MTQSFQELAGLCQTVSIRRPDTGLVDRVGVPKPGVGFGHRAPWLQRAQNASDGQGEARMRALPLVLAVFIATGAGRASAQEWVEYVNRNDFFTINFPSEPTVESVTYTSEYGGKFPGRVYRSVQGSSRYAISVINYSDAERIHTERAKSCPPDGHTGCTGAPYTGVGSWKTDVRGAIDFATAGFLKRDAKVSFFGWSFVDLVEGRQLQLTNADASRTFVGIYMHENRLYILEATVPKGMPEPGFFQQSLGFIDAEGKGIRYTSIYSNGFPAPPRVK